ncbi:hypothetical protein [Microcoleus sp. FACHB-68]|uniref:hypothetical protein n=1 Tax=Microcoleus sp. FACHB-68 TaxID=2692826 RepID=UPI00168A04F2|nr:hypothetical protein [Microcoleus sp. FACHB-68]MBD1940538.1 hypothetical protein [Microcoleus sp. FACHB-68]
MLKRGSNAGTLNCPDTQLYLVGIEVKSDWPATTRSFCWQAASSQPSLGIEVKPKQIAAGKLLMAF